MDLELQEEQAQFTVDAQLQFIFGTLTEYDDDNEQGTMNKATRNMSITHEYHA